MPTLRGVRSERQGRGDHTATGQALARTTDAHAAALEKIIRFI